MNQFSKCAFAALVGLCFSAGVNAQSTVGELLEKGGKQMTKEDFMQNLPARIQQQWPNRQGEEELFFSLDGKITGTGTHYASRTSSPAEGTWKMEDDGKLCVPKKWTNWGSSANLCWYGYVLGNDVFGALKTEPDSKIFKVNSFGKAGG
ncbi:MAG: DUF995 domain-containing protein [Rhodoferax sp.]